MQKESKRDTSEQDAAAEMIELLAELSSDPVTFVHAAFPWGEGELEGQEPLEWQLDILTDIRDGLCTPDEAIREAVASGHGIGKSCLVSWIILWSISTHENTRGVVTANTEAQLATKTWPELGKWYNLFFAKSLFVYTATALFTVQKEYQKNWRIDAIPWSEMNTEAFAGLHNKGNRILVVFDEASAIADTIWDVTEGALTDQGTEIIWCAFGNPTRTNGRFFDCFHKFRKRWNTQQIDSRDVSITNKALIDGWREDYGEDSDFFKVRVRGEFPSASANQFISHDIVESAVKRIIREQDYSFAPAVIGVDPAWTGEDSMEVILRQGCMAKHLMSVSKNDDDVRMAGKIADLQDKYNAVSVNIDMGYGQGIYSSGRYMGRTNWRLVSFASKPINEAYANKRAEMWAEMKTWLKENGCIEDDRILRDDLEAPEAFINLSNKLQLESKDSMKKRGVPSPNKGDALALTFAFKVHPESIVRRARRLNRTNTDYDPYQRR